MSAIAPHEFVVAATAEQAVERLTDLHRQAVDALSQALKHYLKDRTQPGEAQRALFHYPELRLTYQCQGEVSSTARMSTPARRYCAASR